MPYDVNKSSTCVSNFVKQQDEEKNINSIWILISQ